MNFETWQNNLAAARHRYQHDGEDESDEEDVYQDLPETSSSSSLLSRFSDLSLGRRMNFHPYPGPGVKGHANEGHFCAQGGVLTNIQALWDMGIGEQPAAVSRAPERIGAFEVGRRKRIGMSPPG